MCVSILTSFLQWRSLCRQTLASRALPWKIGISKRFCGPFRLHNRVKSSLSMTIICLRPLGPMCRSRRVLTRCSMPNARYELDYTWPRAGLYGLSFQGEIFKGTARLSPINYYKYGNTVDPLLGTPTIGLHLCSHLQIPGLEEMAFLFPSTIVMIALPFQGGPSTRPAKLLADVCGNMGMTDSSEPSTMLITPMQERERHLGFQSAADACTSTLSLRIPQPTLTFFNVLILVQ